MLRVLHFCWKRAHVVERFVAYLAAAAGAKSRENVVDEVDFLTSCTPMGVLAVATGDIRTPLNAGVSSDHELYGVVHIAFLLRQIADELPALVVDHYR